MNGPAFEVVTDNNPLTYVLSSAKLSASGLRWVAELANYNFTIRYRSGKKHIDADYLSRHAVAELLELQKEADKAVEKKDVSLLFAAAYRGESILNHRNVDVVEIQQKNLLREVSAEEMKLAQMEDEVIAPVYQLVQEGRKCISAEMKKWRAESKILWRPRSPRS